MLLQLMGMLAGKSLLNSVNECAVTFGYRGEKITERPEKLKKEIKSKAIMEFDDFKNTFDDFIETYFNNRVNKGKILQGKSPNELWNEEFKVKKVMSKDALKFSFEISPSNYLTLISKCGILIL